MLLLALLCIFTLLEEWLRQETTAGQRIGEERRQLPSDESGPQPGRLRNSAWSEAALGLPATQAGLRRCPRRQGIIVGAENAPAPNDLQTTIVSPRACIR